MTIANPLSRDPMRDGHARRRLLTRSGAVSMSVEPTHKVAAGLDEWYAATASRSATC